jgi:HK97 family phage major capsid protein
MQTSPDIEQLIRQDFGAVLARAADTVAINGGGSNEPTGVLANSSVDDTTDMVPPTWAGVLELISKVEEANATGTAFLTRPSVVKKLRSTVKVGSTDSVMIMQEPRNLAGYPLSATNLVPEGLETTELIPLIFGNWPDLIMGFWSELDILVNPYESTAYSKGNVQVRAMMTADIALRHTQSFAYANVDLESDG